MSELQRFLPADQDLLVGVMYRTGVWMSHIDDTDETDKSEDKERAKMLSVLKSISTSAKAGELVAEIAEEAIRQQPNWPRWSATADAVLSDVPKVKALMRGQGTRDEYVAFGKALMMIATSVARAYREENDSDHEEEGGYFGWLSDKASELTMALTDRETHRDLNISPAEDTALNDLLAALKS